jgi:hypothetical protein
MPGKKPEETATVVSPCAQEPILEPRVGWIAGVEGGAPLVDYPGNPGVPVRARSAVKLAPEALLAAAASGQGAVLLFEEGDPGRPLLMGVLEPESETPFLDEILAAPAREAKVVEVDGDRVLLDAKREVVIRCGRSSIRMSRNGIVLSGVRIETRAAGLHRVKSGKTEIN